MTTFWSASIAAPLFKRAGKAKAMAGIISRARWIRARLLRTRWEMSVGLARYNGMLFRDGHKVMAHVKGRMFQAGQAEPSED
jgi:hypothetical protein